MTPFRSDIWVAAFVRRHNDLGHLCVVARRGDPVAGQIFIHVDHLDGTVSLYAPAPASSLADGEADRVFQRRFDHVAPEQARDRLAREVYAKLPAGARGLLITLDYPAGEMEGPPFSVDESEVHRLFDAQWDIRQLDHLDILASQPAFAQDGVTALHTTVYALTRRGG